MSVTEEDVRRAVRAEAAGHVPDRLAMLDRVTRTAMRREPVARRPSGRLLIAGAAAAVTAVLGGGGIAQWSLAGDGDYQPAPTGPIMTAVPTGPLMTAAPSSPAPSAEVRQKNKPSPLRANGSVDPGGKTQANSVVTLESTERLQALTVTIRLARTPELVSRGGSRQVPGASVTTSVTEEDDALTYRYVLSSADVIEPGTSTFHARYRHAEGGRDAAADSYEITATTAGGRTLTVTGDFG